jgi:hypothetical protein
MAISEDISGFHKGKMGPPDIYQAQVKDDNKHPAIHRTAPYNKK